MKKVLALLLAMCMVVTLFACGKNEEAPKNDSSASSTQTNDSNVATKSAMEDTEVKKNNVVADETTKVEKEEDTTVIQDITKGELVNGKFATTREITVEVYDRDSAKPSADNNIYTQWIQQQMLDKYNVKVTYVPVSRWSEDTEITNLLAGGTAPDICYTYKLPVIQTYASYGGVLDIQEYLTEEYKGLFPNLWNWLGSVNIYGDQNPETGEIYSIEGKRNNTYKINTFVREDWLKKLNMAAPTTTAEFEAMLVAFRDNAELLLGADADKMVPFSISYDVGWRASNLIDSKLDPAMTDKEFYVNGFDDRMFTQNGTKEAVKLLNKWYNDGLIWKDFALYGSGDTTEDDMIKAGYVGAFQHNYDYPFRDEGNSINCTLEKTYGEGAHFIAINCFEDKNGTYSHYSYSPAGDRKTFFPATNDEPLASMLYLDFISSPEAIEHIQTGGELGVTYTVHENGAVEVLKPEDEKYNVLGGNNIDLTITCNGLRLADENLTSLSLALGYPGNDPQLIADAMAAAAKDAKAPKTITVETIEEEGTLGTALNELRDAAYDTAVRASVAEFDAVWEKGMNDYLAAGGADIIAKREIAWKNAYGNATMLAQ